jgi:hypothetical protein
MKALCGPKFLRDIREPGDGFCCGLGKDGKPDPELTERVKRRALVRYLALAPADKSDRPDRSRTLPRGEQGRRQMLEVGEADLELEAGFVHVKGSPGMPQIARRRERSAFQASRCVLGPKALIARRRALKPRGGRHRRSAGARDQGLHCRPASGDRADRQPCIGYEEDQRHHAPQDYLGHDPATGIRTLWARRLHKRAKGTCRETKDHIGDVTAADEGCPFPNTVHGTPSGGVTIAD